jgi:hypothetical protein
LTSALAGGEWSALRPGRFVPRGKSRSTHCIGCWVGLRGGLDNAEKRKFLTLPGREPSESMKYWTSGSKRGDVTPLSSVEVHQTTRRLIQLSFRRAQDKPEEGHLSARRFDPPRHLELEFVPFIRLQVGLLVMRPELKASTRHDRSSISAPDKGRFHCCNY